TVSNGIVTFSDLSISKAGTGYTLVANSGSLINSTSTPFNIALPSTTTALTSSASSAVWKQSVTFTATVSGSGTPTGMVIFYDGTTNLGQGTLSTSSGKTTASFSTAGLTVGTHTITASYGGDSNFASSSSAAFTQTVAKASTSTVLA